MSKAQVVTCCFCAVVVCLVQELEAKREEGMVMIEQTDSEGRHLLVRTDALEDKAVAVRMLACFISDMGTAFLPYVDQAMAVMGPLAVDSCFDDIRLAALAALPDLVKVLRLSAQTETQRSHLGELFIFAVQKILEGLCADAAPGGEVSLGCGVGHTSQLKRATGLRCWP